MATLQPTKEKANGTKLRRLLLDGGTQVLRNLFDEIHPPTELEGVLKVHESHLRHRCNSSQIDLLFPTAGSPCSTSFDISLLSLLLKDICGIIAPYTGWKDKPNESDRSHAANILRIRLLRNQYQHFPSSEIPDSKFDQLWQEISVPLIDLGMKQDEIDRLKTSPIQDLQDDVHGRIFELEKTVYDLQTDSAKCLGFSQSNIREQSTKEHATFVTLQSCIPDAPPIFIGRKDILQDIIKDESPLVIVHGMAGIGKSTLIKKAAWDLHRQFAKTVFYVDLWKCKAVEEEISKTIVTVLGRIKVAMNPIEALDNWVRNLKQEVILVLDNAEDVLTHNNNELHESGDFAKTLLKVRQFSNQKVRFLVASREAFSIDLPLKEIKMGPMSEHEGVQVINEYLQERGCQEDEVTKQTLAELCFNIPLALKLVTALLEDFQMQELIEVLQSNRLTVLGRLKQAVSLSFNKLSDKQRSIFAEVTVFAAHFTASAAAAVIELNKLDTVSHLNSLCRINLLQKANGKYFIHPFIHEYAAEYGKRCAKNNLQKAEKNFVDYYQSLLLENTNLFWTKNKCKESLNSFYEDRTNIVAALERMISLPSLEHTQWVKPAILKKMVGVVRYLENCVSWDLLEKLIEVILKLDKKNNLTPQKLELVCWNAHFYRRKSDHKKYDRLVQQAKHLYEANQMNLPCTTQICYKLFEAKYFESIGREKDAIKVLNDAVKVCKVSTDVSPMIVVDYARATAMLVHYMKNVSGNESALEAFKQHQTLEICMKHLGEHIHTALCFKDLSDRYIDVHSFKEALAYNDKALEMFSNLNSGLESPVALLLKNRGICYRNLGKYEESEECLLKANQIANSITSEGSTYKFWINAELAILYDKINDVDRAKASAKSAIDIAINRKFSQSNWRHYESILDNILKK